jgi:hypothetical protein
MIIVMADGGFGKEDNGEFGNEDSGFGNEEDNNCNVLNEHLLEPRRLDDAGGEEDEEVSVGVGSGGGGGSGGAYEAETDSHESVDVDVDDVMDDEAVRLTLLPRQLVDATIVFPADAHDNDDVPIALSIPHGFLSSSDLSNAPVAENTRSQYLVSLVPFLSPRVFAHDGDPTVACNVLDVVADSSSLTRMWWEVDIR